MYKRKWPRFRSQIQTKKQMKKTNLLIRIVIGKFLQSCRKVLLSFVETPLFQI